MAYGKIKADAIIRDNGGSDEEITMATIVGLDSNKASLTGATFTGDITLNAQEELRLADSDSSNYIALKAPATVGSNVTLTFPADDGDANEVLTTNGSGVLSWAAAGGKVLQMASTRNTTAVSSSREDSNMGGTSTDGAQCAALTVTRQSATSVMIIWANLHGYVSANNFGNDAIFAGTTAVACMHGNGYSADTSAGSLFGSIPSSDVGSGAVVYQLRTLGTRGASATRYVNTGNSGTGTWGVGQTQLVVMEVEP